MPDERLPYQPVLRHFGRGVLLTRIVSPCAAGVHGVPEMKDGCLQLPDEPDLGIERKLAAPAICLSRWRSIPPMPWRVLWTSALAQRNPCQYWMRIIESPHTRGPMMPLDETRQP